MKVAVWHNLPSGGGLRALCNQLDGLAARGHELHLLAPPSAAHCAAMSVAASSREVALGRPSQNSSTLQALAAAWRGRRDDLDAYAEHASQCATEIAAIDPDVVLVHPCQFFNVPAIAQHLETPCVLYCQEPNRALFEATFRPSRFPWTAAAVSRRLGLSSVKAFVREAVRVEQARIQLRIETESIHAYDEVLVNSQFSRESVLRAYGRLSRVSELGIDTERFGFGERPAHGRGAVLSVGAMVPEKRAVFLIDAVAAAGPAVRRFVWVANYVDRRYRELVDQAATKAGISLDLRESVSDEDLLQAYMEADVFVYAPRLEPFGLAPLEANATGLPVVAVAEGGVRETIVDGVNGVLAEHDTASFGATVAAMLRDIGRARALGVSAREHVVRRWPLSRSIDTLESNLLAALAQPRRPVRSPVDM